MNSVLEILKKINIKGAVSHKEDMKKHTTFKTGGNAEIFVKTSEIDDIIKIKKASIKYGFPLFILGGGANILVSDKGIPGVTLSLENLNSISHNNTELIVETGLSVNKMSEYAYNEALEGMEFIYGMPGSVGGAIWMNARCYGEEISDSFLWADYLSPSGEVKRLYKKSSDWDYKISPFQEDGIIILKACFKLKKGKYSEIKTKMDKNFSDRRLKGHFKFPCAGSVFKNNRVFGAPSGKIIEEAGLKGLKKGNAQISDFHANIIVNLGNAKSSDIYFLIQRVIKEVKDKRGFIMEPEVLLVGDWEE